MSSTKITWVVTLAVALLAGAVAARFASRLVGDRTEESLPAPEPDSLLALFEKTVVPVLDRRCGNCHGVDTMAFVENIAHFDDQYYLAWPVGDSGRIHAEHLTNAYQRCTGTESEDILQPLDLSGPALASPLARAPLSPEFSGHMRAHPEIFASPHDPDLVALLEWIEAERAAQGAKPPALEGEAELFFAEQVVPVLSRKTCFGANCHGPLAFNDLKLDPGIPALSERFTPAMHKANRKAMLGKVTRLVHLHTDLEQSKQLLKNIPTSEGGVVHKGGNDFFVKGDPDYNVLLRWLELEAKELRKKTGAPLGEDRGLIFVRRPRHTPERFFESDTFMPGAQLVWRREGQEVILSEVFDSPGALDLRAPDVSYDATKVAFALRRSVEEPFNIWEIELATGAARQLTYSRDPKRHFVEPLYTPDPDDHDSHDVSRVCVVMTSNHLGEWCRSSEEAILGEAEGGSRTEIVDDQLTERPGTYTGKALRIVRGTNTGESRRIAEHAKGRLVLDQPLPERCDSTTHYVIDVEARMAPRYDGFRMRHAPPGKERETFESTLSRMTYTVDQVRRPSIRSDGSPVFTMLRIGWQEDRPYFNGALFRLHDDGSEFHPHNANRSGVPIHCDDRELPSGLEVRIGRDANSYWGGMLILSDHQFGITIEPDNPLDNHDHPYVEGKPNASSHRFVPGWIALDPDATFKGISPGGAYRDPYPMPDGSILVAHAAGPVDLADPDADPNFDILRLVPDPSFHSQDGFRAGSFRREILAGGELSELWPRPVFVRPKESVHKTLKTDVDLYGEPQRVRGFRGYPRGTTAVAKIFDYFLIDAFFEQSAPMGTKRIAMPVNPVNGEAVAEIDQVKFVRLIAGVEQREGDTGAPAQRMVLEAPVAKDGSVYLEAPSAESLMFQSLNADRMALRSGGRWLYLHPGEKYSLSVPHVLYAQTCSGCHGALSGKPMDTLRKPDALTSASRTSRTWNADTHRTLMPMNWKAGIKHTAVTFERDIQPILHDHCLQCHSADTAEAGLDLSGDGAFGRIRAYVNYREALSTKSRLIELLSGKELHAPEPLEDGAGHSENMGLSEEQLLTFVRWVDLGAQR